MYCHCFVHSSVEGHLGCFCRLAVINNAALNTGVQISTWVSVLGFFGCIPRVEPLSHKAVPFLIFEETPYCFSQWSNQATFPATVHKGSFFSTSSVTLVVVCGFIDANHFDRCEAIPRVFNFHFSDDQWPCVCFHISVVHLYVLFGDVSFQVLWPFLNWIVYFFWWGVIWFLYKFWILITIGCGIGQYLPSLSRLSFPFAGAFLCYAKIFSLI